MVVGLEVHVQLKTETKIFCRCSTNFGAAPNANTLQSYSIRFTCTLRDDRQQLAGAELFVRGETVVITPTFEPVPGTLQARAPQSDVLLTVPPGALKPGSYTMTLVGERVSRTWPVNVK
jgi:hypothetical protein